jgi:hypothetical protein
MRDTFIVTGSSDARELLGGEDGQKGGQNLVNRTVAPIDTQQVDALAVKTARHLEELLQR